MMQNIISVFHVHTKAFLKLNHRFCVNNGATHKVDVLWPHKLLAAIHRMKRCVEEEKKTEINFRFLHEYYI